MARGSRRSTARDARRSGPPAPRAARGSSCAVCRRASSASTSGSVVAGDQRVEHRAPGLAEDVRGDAVELDAGVLERLVQPVGLALRAPGSASCDSASGCAAARIGLGGTKLACSSPASASWHSHAASETSVLRPGTCLTCRALTSMHSNSSSRIAHDRLPIDAGGLHHDLRDAVRGQPVAQRQQPADRRRELRHVLLAPAALVRAPARTRSPAPCGHPAPPGARRSSPSLASSHDRHDTTAAQGPQRTNESDRRARSTVRSSGETPHAKLTRAHRHQGKESASRATPESSPLFMRPRASAKRTENSKEQSGFVLRPAVALLPT